MAAGADHLRRARRIRPTIPGKEVLQSVYQFTRDPEFEGRVAFLEDYDMHLAHLLVQGVDLWINLPRVPLEASGTSGMKAALNGVPQLSTLDGWWQEGYDGLSGWAISPAGESEDADAADAEQFYRLLEEQVIPLYYTRNAAGVPLGWVEKMRHALRLAGSTIHRPAHGPELRAGALRSGDPRRIVRGRSAHGMRLAGWRPSTSRLRAGTPARR